MFLSNEWKASKFYQKEDAIDVEYIILDVQFWKSIMYYLKFVWPLVKVFTLVRGDLKPAMGYI